MEQVKHLENTTEEMSMKVIINEEQLPILYESGNVTFLKFFSNIKEFLADLLTNPINAKPNKFMRDNGFKDKELRQELIDRDIVKRKVKIDEPVGADGKIHSTYSETYRVPKSNFKKKIRDMYNDYYEDEKLRRD